MDEFINSINPHNFRLTNQPWNSLMLNDPWSVGYVSTLIELKPFQSKEKWESFYYEMGEYRLKKIAQLSQDKKNILNNEQLIRTNKNLILKLPVELKNLNTENGRTKEELNNKGKILHDFVKLKHPEISLSDCQEAVRFRVICETWNGVVLREHNTIKTLQKEFTSISFIKKDGVFDHHYAVDYEMADNDKLVCGIQIKPISYTYNTPYINRAKAANQRKNILYTEKFNKPVFNIIANQKGIINNKSVINEIRKLI